MCSLNKKWKKLLTAEIWRFCSIKLRESVQLPEEIFCNLIYLNLLGLNVLKITQTPRDAFFISAENWVLIVAKFGCLLTSYFMQLCSHYQNMLFAFAIELDNSFFLHYFRLLHCVERATLISFHVLLFLLPIRIKGFIAFFSLIPTRF